jgi:hypothetical protein
VHRRRIGQHQRVQLAEDVRHLPPVEVDQQLAGLGVDRPHQPQVAVEHLLLVVVRHLHHLVAGAEGPAEALDPGLARRVQQPLQLEIERAGAEPATVHRA